MTYKHKTISIGVDVAKAHLDVYCMTDQSAIRFTNDTLCQTSKMLQDMCGVGPITAYSLLADLPELGRIGNKSISSLIGVAPMFGTHCIWRH